MAKKEQLLWADDEIDLLRPHILFLKEKGYEVTTVVSGQDAIDVCRNNHFDIIFLDENMPGLTGLETLNFIKEITPTTPVVMITKSEEESIMEQAIGSRIADYLIKPVNPNQIILSIKKLLHKDNIVSEANTSGYRQEYSAIAMMMQEAETPEDWEELYHRLTYWQVELSETQSDLISLLDVQRKEANSLFSRFIERNYQSWVNAPADERPLISPDFISRRVFPLLNQGDKVCFVLLDNLRFDQWLALKPLLDPYFTIQEEIAYSILPSVTQFSRNSIFAGLMPLQIQKMFPDLWVGEEDEEHRKNLYEEELLASQLQRYRKSYTFNYHKVLESAFGERLLQQFNNSTSAQLNVFVVNFVDMLSHARTESKMIRELISSEAAYRSLTVSWFRHNFILDLFRQMAEAGFKIVLATDHGSVHVTNPVKVVGDRETTTNLRYKQGRRLSYNPKQVFAVTNPHAYGLPTPNLSTSYIFATGDDFLSYPNNYNHYVKYYKGTFQHGGVSMEEMMLPLVTLTPK